MVVLVHPEEHRKPTNTGHLARLLLPSATVLVAERAGSVESFLGSNRNHRAALLFPRGDARPLDRSHGGDPPLTLVVPDARWPQARKMATRWPRLRDLPALSLPDGPTVDRRLRKSRRGPAALETLEAIARALGILECQYVEDCVRTLYQRVVARGLYARGRAKADRELLEALAAARHRGIDVP